MRLVVGLLLLQSVAHAATINIAPGDSYSKMEAAQAGDEVVIAPGTYNFRVDWENAGTAAAPITVRAQDPNNRPVWDLTGTMVGDAPGSYGGGDKGRGCWQFRGGYYRVDGIVFKNCIDHSSAGLRVVNVPSIEVRHSLFVGNTNGMTGAGDGTVIEYCEFDTNGNALPGDNAAHQIYIFGGTLAVRWSYFHDSPAGQNFHVRARDATLEYNWFTRPGSYTGDIMSCEYFCGGSGTDPITQTMLLRGNVIVQGMPQNHGQLIALYNDEGASSDASGQVSHMDITLDYNTIIGESGVINDVVHHLNNSGISTAAHLSDNAILSFQQVNLIEAPGMGNATVDGTTNWVSTGTDATSLTATITGADAMLDADYRPQPGSPLIGAAMSLGSATPTSEYFFDETTTAQARARATALDVGAFESTTMGEPDGGTSSMPDLSSPMFMTDLAAQDRPHDLGHGKSSSGCGCEVGARAPSAPWWMLLLLLVYLARARWRSPEKVCASTRPSPEP
jgi:MYXO-CTERM domain-containing protein